MLVDLSAGRQGPLDHRPVKPSTVFCVFSAGKAICSTAVHILVDRGLLRYDQRVADLWPEFARNGKEDTTVRKEFHATRRRGKGERCEGVSSSVPSRKSETAKGVLRWGVGMRGFICWNFLFALLYTERLGS